MGFLHVHAIFFAFDLLIIIIFFAVLLATAFGLWVDLVA